MTMTNSDKDIAAWLADPDNLAQFIAVSKTLSLGYVLTKDGSWVKLDT